MKKAFDIQGINNRLEALAKYLGVNSEIKNELSTIEQRHIAFDGFAYVDSYLHKGTMYFVASSGYGLIADKVVEFNSSFWAILAQKKEAPYVRFSDQKVMDQLRSISPDGHKLLAINQKAHKVLFRTESGFLVVYSFTSHVPEDITTYYFRGCVTNGLRDIKTIFESTYSIKNSDITLNY